MVRIVTTMTVIPTREKSIIKTIRSIQEGTLPPCEMYVNVPLKYARFKEKLDPKLVPKLLEMGVHVNIIDHDWACLNKILPILAYETNPDTLIVTLDDDMTYSKYFIQGLYQGWKEFGGVVGYSAITYPETSLKVKNNLEYLIYQGHGAEVEMLEFGFGTMFEARCLQGFPEVEPLTPTADATFHLSDDYVMSRFFDYKNIKKRFICYDPIGRVVDDWKSICTENEDAKTHAISSSQNSLMNYIKSGEIIKKRWGWFT